MVDAHVPVRVIRSFFNLWIQQSLPIVESNNDKDYEKE